MRAGGWTAFALLALLGAAPASAQVGLTWEDPTLAAAVADADLVVLAEAVEVGRHGAAYRLLAAPLKGARGRGDVVPVVGLHHPERRERPPVEVGDRAYLVLRGDAAGSGFALPTPTFGRFPLRRFGEEELVIASLGGIETYARIGVPAARFEALLRAFLAGPPPELLGFARETLRAEAPDSEALYLALEVVARWGRPEDAGSLQRVLEDPRYAGSRLYRLRLASARGLAVWGGARAARILLRVAEEDPDVAVRSGAIAGLGRAARGHGDTQLGRRVIARLRELAGEADADPIAFADAEDPRTNRLDSPLAACLSSLAQLAPRQGVKPALAALERDDLEAIVAGLAYFAALRDVELAGQVAERMRPAGSPDVFVNRLFARTLEDLSGQRLGEDRAAWLRWWRQRRPGGPVGPPAPGGGGR